MPIDPRGAARAAFLSTLACLALAGCSSSSGADAGTTCAPPLVACGGACVDLRSDPSHCSQCGLACAGSQACVKGACFAKTCASATCTETQVCVDSVCIDRLCVAAGCSSDQVCEAGVCKPKPTCTPGGACVPDEPCRTGSVTCTGNVAACVADNDLEDGTSCGEDQVCKAGECVAQSACTPACTGSRKCDVSSGKCVECLADGDCAGSSKGKRCHRTKRTCVECVSAADCAAGTCTSASVCGECAKNADCLGNAKGEVCSSTTHTCGGCTGDADCAGSLSGPRCNQGRCVECVGPADCPFSKPGCNENRCGTCFLPTDCPGATGSCGEDSVCHCDGDADCGGDAPTCIKKPGVYRCGCLDSSACGSRVCDGWRFTYGACVVPCTDPAAGCDPKSSLPFCDTGAGDPNYGVCLPCFNDGDCVQTGAGKFCTSAGCVQCRADADCKAADPKKPFCTGLCVQCRGPSDCPAGQGCNSATKSCGSCSRNDNCPTGQGCLAGQCRPLCVAGGPAACAICSFNAECPASAPKCSSGMCIGENQDAGMPPTCGGSVCVSQVCDPAAENCVDCLEDADCVTFGRGSYCDKPNRSCLQCRTGADCPFSAPACSDGLCGFCTNTSDCRSGLTCGTDDRCHCTSNASCGGDAPVCVPGNLCGCTSDSQCGSGRKCDNYRWSTGRCVELCTVKPCDPDSGWPICDADPTSPVYGLCLPCLSAADCSPLKFCTPQGCANCRSNADCAATPATPRCLAGSCSK